MDRGPGGGQGLGTLLLKHNITYKIPSPFVWTPVVGFSYSMRARSDALSAVHSAESMDKRSPWKLQYGPPRLRAGSSARGAPVPAKQLHSAHTVTSAHAAAPPPSGTRGGATRAIALRAYRRRCLARRCPATDRYLPANIRRRRCVPSRVEDRPVRQSACACTSKKRKG